jgi:hypothetical protein
VKSLGKTLDKQLKKLAPETVTKAMPGLIEQISTDMISSSRSGFSLKSKNVRSGNDDHVSIDKKKVSKAWVAALKRL